MGLSCPSLGQAATATVPATTPGVTDATVVLRYVVVVLMEVASDMAA